jgi:hypothetical protein
MSVWQGETPRRRHCPHCGQPLPGVRVAVTASADTPSTADLLSALAPLEEESEQQPHSEEKAREVRSILAKVQRELRQERHRKSGRRPLERSVLECVGYPVRALGGIACLAFGWALGMALWSVAVVVTPADGDLVNELRQAPLGISLLSFFALLGVTWNYSRQVYGQALAGNRQGTAPLMFLFDYAGSARCALTACVTLLAGPAWLLATAAWFWIHAGTMEWFDHVLLWQLWLCAGIGWVYLLLAVNADGRLRHAHAKAVLSLLRKQGWPALVFPLAGGFALTVFVYLSTTVWLASFDGAGAAFVLQFLLWCAMLFCWTFLLRGYGIMRYWREVERNIARERRA